MATYHCSVKKGKSGKGSPHANYIMREGEFSNAKMKEDLVHKEHGNLPSWAKDGNDFWKNADCYERSNANVYMEFELALPNELTKEQQIKLTKDFINEHIGENKTYTFAIHEKDATLNAGTKQPHAHIMFSERINDDIRRTPKQYFSRYNDKNISKGGVKKDDRFSKDIWTGSNNVKKIRKSWEEYQNKTLEKYGHTERVSCEKLDKQREEAINNNDIDKIASLERPAEKALPVKVVYEIGKQQKKYSSKEEYFDKNKNKSKYHEQAYKNFIAREHKLLQKELQELRKEQEKYQEQQQENTTAIKDLKAASAFSHTQIKKSELIPLINEHINKIEINLKDHRYELYNIRKDSLNDVSINRIAQSVYTKGATKRLKKEALKIASLKDKYNKRLATFKEKPKPKFFEVIYKKEWEDQQEKLQKWSIDIENREIKNNKEIDYIKRKLASPEGVAKVKQISNAIKERNTIRDKRIIAAKTNIETLAKQRRELIELKQEIRQHDRENYDINKEFTNVKQVNGNSINSAISSIKANNAEAKAKGGITAKIKDDQREIEELEHER